MIIAFSTTSASTSTCFCLFRRSCMRETCRVDIQYRVISPCISRTYVESILLRLLRASGFCFFDSMQSVLVAIISQSRTVVTQTDDGQA